MKVRKIGRRNADISGGTLDEKMEMEEGGKRRNRSQCGGNIVKRRNEEK